MDRIDAVEAGKQIRARIEADRRARGIPAHGFYFPGEGPPARGPKIRDNSADDGNSNNDTD